MLFMAEVIIMAGFFWFGSAGQEIRTYSVGQHIGASLALTMLIGWLLPWVVPTEVMNEIPWLLGVLVYSIAAWLCSWPLAKLIYSAGNREASVIATYAAVGWMAVALFMRWAIS